MRSTARERKASGIEWIGEIPAHWSIKRLKFVTALAYGDSLSTDKRIKGDVPVYGSNGQVGTHDAANTIGKTIIVGRKGSYGKVNLSNEPVFAIDTTYFVDRRFTREDIDWLYYLLCCLKLDFFSKDFAVPGLAREEAYERLCPVPPLSEQRSLVVRLARETAHIQSLLIAKGPLLKTLEEKLVATITHAVTKGLDANVALQSSGTEWFGNIPTHWILKKIKYCVRHVVDCLHTTPHYDGELLYPAVRTADLERGRLLLEQARLVSEEVYRERIARLRPMEGDILYSREGERFGLAALVPKDVTLCLGQRMMMFRVLPNMVAAYLMWSLNSAAIFQQVVLHTGGSTSPHVNIGDIINFFVTCPPREEQEAIAGYVQQECSKIDALADDIRKGIERLEEYLAGLITDTITGKIDLEGMGKLGERVAAA